MSNKDILKKINDGQVWYAIFDWHSKTHVNGIYMVQHGNKVTHFDTKNKKFVSDYWFDDAHNFGRFKWMDVAIVINDGKYNVLKKDGTLLFTDWKGWIGYHDWWNDGKSENFFVCDNDRKYIMDKNGNILLEINK